MNRQLTQPDGRPNPTRKRCDGFSLVELLIVVVIVLIVAGMTIPKFITLIHNAKLQGAASDFASLLQKGRIRAVQDDTYYSTYFKSAGTINEAYVDIAKNGGTSIDITVDPVISMSNEVSAIAASSAPNTSALKGLFLPTGSTLTVIDGGSSSTPIIFNSRGFPCTSISVPGGTLCSSSSTYTTAYWVFFQNSYTNVWEAVTISPAGRIQKWGVLGSSWAKM
jgi:prepilin-type N-terminal cleavage/methylation domain-containing protein